MLLFLPHLCDVTRARALYIETLDGLRTPQSIVWSALPTEKGVRAHARIWFFTRGLRNKRASEQPNLFVKPSESKREIATTQTSVSQLVQANPDKASRSKSWPATVFLSLGKHISELERKHPPLAAPNPPLTPHFLRRTDGRETQRI